jgi:hypothetical protein
MSPVLADCVAKLFLASKSETMIQNQAQILNVDSKREAEREQDGASSLC